MESVPQRWTPRRSAGAPSDKNSRASCRRAHAFFKLLRQVEVHVGKWERAQTGADADVAAGLFEEAKEFASDICFVSSGKKSAVGGGSDGDLSPSKARGGDGEAQEPEEAELSSPLKTGAAVGDESSLLLAPFELHGTWRKATQAALCAELIETTKSRFNRKFDELLAAKKAELERIGEKMVSRRHSREPMPAHLRHLPPYPVSPSRLPPGPCWRDSL